MPPSMSRRKGAARASPFHPLPTEASKLIATYVSLESLAKLRILSKEARQFFSPILYTSIHYPKKPGVLLFTLASPQKNRSAALGAHPAALVRELRIGLSVDVPYGARPSETERLGKQKEQLQKLLCSALDNTARVSGGKSPLRLFYIRGNVGLEDAGRVLADQRRFPNLKKLLVRPWRSEITGRKTFDFLSTPHLVYLEYEEDISIHIPGGPALLEKMGSSLTNISPHLHTLKLTFSGVPSIIPIINALRLPLLRVVMLDISDIKLGGALTLHPFLQSHPALTDVSVDLKGKALDPAALPRLQSFSGSFKDPISICDGKRPIQSLVLTLPSPNYDFHRKYTDKAGKQISLEPIIFQRLSSASALKKLHLPVQQPDEGEEGDSNNENLALSTKTVEKLAEACPNLTELELHIDGILSCSPSLAKFQHLEKLKLHIFDACLPRLDPSTSMALELGIYTINRSGSQRGRCAYANPYDSYGYDDDVFESLDDLEDSLPPAAASDYFPAGKLARDIERCLAKLLPKLRIVELQMSGNRDPEYNQYKEDYAPDFEIGYIFEIFRKPGKIEIELVEVIGEED